MTQEALTKVLNQLKRADQVIQSLCPQGYIHPVLGSIHGAIVDAQEALADHAMQEVQRLGQEIEQEPKIKTTDPFESSRVADYNRGWNDCLFASGVVKQPEQEPVAIKRMKEWIEYLKRKSDFGQHMKIPSEMSAGTCWELAIELEQFINTTPPQRTEQEPVAWPCLIDSADFSEKTITLVMQCEDYKVSAGTHWLSTTPPQPEQKPVAREHVTDSSKCWCDPELDYKDPDTGVEVWVHRSKQ